jgi:hypothetical protein
MPTKSTTRSVKTATRPRESPARKQSESLIEIKRWWERVRKPLGPQKEPHESPISCTGPISTKTGTEPLYHDVSTKYATWPSGAYVDFVSLAFAFGLGIPVTYTPTAAGFSFLGHIPVCTKSSVCSNGQPLVWQVYVKGEVKTSPEPDELTYTYSIDAFCGGVLSCTENGTFSGKRKTGKSNTLEGSFYGKQAYTRRCCPKRHI